MPSPPEHLNELLRIISGALRLDTAKVRNYAAFLAEKLESEGQGPSAERIRHLLAETDHQLQPAKLTTRTVPVDGETRFPLLERASTDEAAKHPVILTAAQREVVDEFISIARAQGQFETLALKSSLCLLLYGPPGTGKTHLALSIAHSLGLPAYVARLDGLISSFLGSTAKNIRAIFEFASTTPAVILLDEFDAIAKLRDDTQEVGELKRVVNSFLQNLDSLGPQSILVAATNHQALLDPAVWRRFTYRVELQYPDAELRGHLWREYLAGTVLPERQFSALVDFSEGFSGADIREASLRIRRTALSHERQPSLNDAYKALLHLSAGDGEQGRFLATLRGVDPQAAARALYERAPKIYSSATLGATLGVSKPTANRWTVNEGGEANGGEP